MKQIFSYYTLIVGIFILSLSAISTFIWEDSIPVNIVQLSHSDEKPNEEGVYFTHSKAPVIFTGLQRYQTQTTNTIVKVDSISYFSRLICSSLLTNQQLFTTKSSYISFCAELHKCGYYLYTLRKLLI